MKKILSIVMIAAVALSAWAVPARRDALLRTAADGTQKTVYLHGNEHFHYLTDAAGNWLDEQTLAPLSKEQKEALQKEGLARQARRAQQQLNGIGDEPNPAPRGLVILANFKDIQFVTPKDTLDSMLNARHFTRSYSYDYEYISPKTGEPAVYHYEGSSEGSARQYFYDQSYGQYNPQFDVVGPVTVSQNASYYGSNNNQNAVRMIIEACKLADQQGVDFSQYDNDQDGYVDFVYVIYAGFGESDGGPEWTIWPHAWDISSYNYKHDGKTLGRYACGSELSFYSKIYMGIGIFCHEFSHVLGLPDLYETNNPQTGIHTLCEWDELDYGPYNNDANTPPSYSAYERFYMKWLTPRMLKDPEYVVLNPINEKDGESLLISTANTHNLVGWNPNPTTFYLLEVHNQDGWDMDLPGPGMLITKIQFNKNTWTGNTVNNNYRSMGVDILEAYSNTSVYGAATDAYPAGSNEWIDFEDHEITNIVRDPATGAVSFSYRNAPIPTDIEEVESRKSKAESRKVLKDGRIYILREGKTYDLLGFEIYEDNQL